MHNRKKVLLYQKKGLYWSVVVRQNIGVLTFGFCSFLFFKFLKKIIKEDSP